MEKNANFFHVLVDWNSSTLQQQQIFLNCLSFEAYYLSVNHENLCIYIDTYMRCAQSLSHV